MSSIALPGAYEVCRAITEHHGKTYALATRLLRPEQRRSVWALYAWARMIDDLVDLDDQGDKRPVSDAQCVESKIQLLDAAFHKTLATGVVPDEPRELMSYSRRAILSAVAETYRERRIDPKLERAFVASMLMDLPCSTRHRAIFDSWAQLDEYTWGSAAVIGLQMLPIIGVRQGVSRSEAAPFAAELGRAFQITNFIRDIAEDLSRTRVYLPMEQWEAFGVDVPHLQWCAEKQRADAPVRHAIAYFIAYNRAVYKAAEPGIELLQSPARSAIAAANVLYSRILDEVEKANYNVFAGRVAVSNPRRAAVAARYGLSVATNLLIAKAPSPGRGA